MRKKWMLTPLFILFILMLIPAVMSSAAPAGWESASKLSFGSPVSDSTSNRDDNDLYYVEVKEPGRLTIRLDHGIYPNTSSNWRICLYNFDKMSSPVYYYNDSPQRTGEISPEMGVVPGTYYISLQTENYYNPLPDSAGYTMTVSFAADKYYEDEYNNSSSTATDIQLNHTYKGYLADRDDNDWFVFTTTKPGYITLKTDHTIYPDSTALLGISIYRLTDSNELAYYQNTSPKKTGDVTSKFGIVPAGTYYICLSSENYYNPLPGNFAYKFSVNFTANNFWEYELNNSAGTANPIKLNNTYSGELRNRDDSDWFSFTVDKAGYVRIKCSHTLYPDSSGLYLIRLYSENDLSSPLYSYTDSPTVSNEETNVMGVQPGKYYISVCSSNYYNPVPDHADYSLKISFTQSELIESEHNGSYASAAPIAPGKNYTADLQNRDDTDYYSFSLTKQADYRIKLSHKIADSSGQWHLAVYKLTNSYELIREDIYPANVLSSESAVFTLTPGDYYIVIQSKNYYNPLPDHQEYTFALTENTAVGDVDLDGKITAADARLALRASVGLERYPAGSTQFIMADADRSGKIEAGDARLILRASVGLEKL